MTNIPQLFSDEQKQYLQGFTTGMLNRGISLAPDASGGHPANDGNGNAGDSAASGAASAAADAAGATLFGTPVDELCKEEKIKLERDSLTIWDTISANADAGVYPTGGDVFRYKFHGLFYVSPAQDSYMIRLRMPGCQLSAHQLRGLATLAETCGGGFADVTTRGNLQIREIPADKAADMLVGLADLDLTSRGSGADNVRNVTASPTSGFDPHELYDVLPLARAMHHTIMHHDDLYGLPRKFNIAFDNGGAISVVADTNDIGLYAVRVPEGEGIPAGVYFKLQLCGITGHRQFASETGILVAPHECVPLCVAILRVFIENGNRGNRNKARLKYLVDEWGLPKLLDAVEAKLDFPLRRFDISRCAPRPAVDRQGHIGIYPERTEGLNYVGVSIPVGRMSADQMRRVSDLADLFGRGDIRLTVWQNLLIPGVATDDLPALRQGLETVGLSCESDAYETGLVACTGSAGCKFGMADTKRHALEISAHLAATLPLDSPINIHLTGCPNSCAQHYCGDIGLMGVKVKRDGESVDGYNMVLGGGVDDQQAVATEFAKALPADQLPVLLERLVRHYLEHRADGETFVDFARRSDHALLKQAMEI